MIFGGYGMQVVIWKSPKALSGLLRLFFGIKKK
ncbi:MAG: stage V sporulation protein SpoVM [Clostridia bacterium]|nr:stage V sporulation protein SpoVM [Clostridia bacterium]